MIRLSEREFEIMELLCEGLTNADISKKTGYTLHIIENTVHDCNLLLGTTNRTQAVLKYIGYID